MELLLDLSTNTTAAENNNTSDEWQNNEPTIEWPASLANLDEKLQADCQVMVMPMPQPASK